jgi:hypothetical protein
MANTGLPVDIVNLLIATAVHLVVHVEITNGHRRITSIREVVDSDGPRIVSNELFAIQDGLTATAAYPMSTHMRKVLANYGYDSARLINESSHQVY